MNKKNLDQLVDTIREAAEREELTTRFFFQYPELQFIFDPEGRITLVNFYAQEKLGYSYKELVGKYFWDFLREDFIADAKYDWYNRNKAIIIPREPVIDGKIHNIYIKKDGTELPLLWSQAWFDSKGHLFTRAEEYKLVEND